MLEGDRARSTPLRPPSPHPSEVEFRDHHPRTTANSHQSALTQHRHRVVCRTSRLQRDEQYHGTQFLTRGAERNKRPCAQRQKGNGIPALSATQRSAAGPTPSSPARARAVGPPGAHFRCRLRSCRWITDRDAWDQDVEGQSRSPSTSTRSDIVRAQTDGIWISGLPGHRPRSSPRRDCE